MAKLYSCTFVLLSTICFFLAVGVVVQRAEARRQCLYKLYPTGCEPDECKFRCLEQKNYNGYCMQNPVEDAAGGRVIDIGDYDYSCWCVIYCAGQGRRNSTKQIGD